jgi:hypothetical protein
VDDRVIAEQAGVTLSTVRGYRYRHGIELDRESVQASTLAPTTRQWAYFVEVGKGDDAKRYTVIAADIAGAGKEALHGLSMRGDQRVVQSLALVNEAL